MKVEEALGVAVPLIFLVLLWIESRSPARPYEPVPKWQWIGAVFFVLTLVIGSITPLLLPAEYLKDHSVLNLSGAGLWGVPPGVLSATFVSYWVHRAEHRCLMARSTSMTNAAAASLTCR